MLIRNPIFGLNAGSVRNFTPKHSEAGAGSRSFSRGPALRSALGSGVFARSGSDINAAFRNRARNALASNRLRFCSAAKFAVRRDHPQTTARDFLTMLRGMLQVVGKYPGLSALPLILLQGLFHDVAAAAEWMPMLLMNTTTEVTVEQIAKRFITKHKIFHPDMQERLGFSTKDLPAAQRVLIQVFEDPQAALKVQDRIAAIEAMVREQSLEMKARMKNLDAREGYCEAFLLRDVLRQMNEQGKKTYAEFLELMRGFSQQKVENEEYAQSNDHPRVKAFVFETTGMDRALVTRVRDFVAPVHADLPRLEDRMACLEEAYAATRALIANAGSLKLVWQKMFWNYEKCPSGSSEVNPTEGWSRFKTGLFAMVTDIVATEALEGVGHKKILPAFRGSLNPNPMRNAIGDLLVASRSPQETAPGTFPLSLEEVAIRFAEIKARADKLREALRQLPEDSRFGTLTAALGEVKNDQGDFEGLLAKLDSPAAMEPAPVAVSSAPAVASEEAVEVSPVVERRVYRANASSAIALSTLPRGEYRPYDASRDFLVADALARIFENFPGSAGKYGDWCEKVKDAKTRRVFFAEMEADLRGFAASQGEDFAAALLQDFKVFREAPLRVVEVDSQRRGAFLKAKPPGSSKTYLDLISTFFGGFVLAGNHNQHAENFIEIYAYLLQEAPEILARFQIDSLVEAMLVDNKIEVAQVRRRFLAVLNYFAQQEGKGYSDFLPAERGIAERVSERLTLLFNLLKSDRLDFQARASLTALGGVRSAIALGMGQGDGQALVPVQGIPEAGSTTVEPHLGTAESRELEMSRGEEAAAKGRMERLLAGLTEQLSFLPEPAAWVLRALQALQDPKKCLSASRITRFENGAYAYGVTQDNLPGRLREGAFAIQNPNTWPSFAKVVPGPYKDYSHDAVGVLETPVFWGARFGWEQLAFLADGAAGNHDMSLAHEPAMASKIAIEIAVRYLQEQLARDPAMARQDLVKQYRVLKRRHQALKNRHPVLKRGKLPPLDIYLREQLLKEAVKVADRVLLASPFAKTITTLNIRWTYQANNGRTYTTISSNGDSRALAFRKNSEGEWMALPGVSALSASLDSVLGLPKVIFQEKGAVEQEHDSVLEKQKIPAIFTFLTQAGDVFAQISDGAVDNLEDGQKSPEARFIELLKQESQNSPNGEIDPQRLNERIIRASEEVIRIYPGAAPELQRQATELDKKMQVEQTQELQAFFADKIAEPIKDREGYGVDAQGIVFRRVVMDDAKEAEDAEEKREPLHRVGKNGHLYPLQGGKSFGFDQDARKAYKKAEIKLQEVVSGMVQGPVYSSAREDAREDQIRVPIVWIDGLPALVSCGGRVWRDGQRIGRIKADNLSAITTVVRSVESTAYRAGTALARAQDEEEE